MLREREIFSLTQQLGKPCTQELPLSVPFLRGATVVMTVDRPTWRGSLARCHGVQNRSCFLRGASDEGWSPKPGVDHSFDVVWSSKSELCSDFPGPPMKHNQNHDKVVYTSNNDVMEILVGGKSDFFPFSITQKQVHKILSLTTWPRFDKRLNIFDFFLWAPLLTQGNFGKKIKAQNSKARFLKQGGTKNLKHMINHGLSIHPVRQQVPKKIIWSTSCSRFSLPSANNISGSVWRGQVRVRPGWRGIRVPSGIR